MGALALFVGLVKDVVATGLTVCAIGLGVEGVVGCWACQAGFLSGVSIRMVSMVCAVRSKSVAKIV